MNDRRCQQMLDDLNNEMDQILYAISHDLRAPLRAIDGFSQAVLEDYEDKLDETGKDYLARVRSGGKKVNTYIDGLLMMSRQSRGDMEITETDVSALTREVVALVEVNYPDHTPEVVIGDGIAAVMDRRLGRFLLEKLLDNAWKFTVGTGDATIEIGSHDEDGATVCFVRDNGVGFDMDYARERLFGAFQRMHPEGLYPGLGTGLATAKRIISRHGGRIWAESEPGKGTTVYFVTSESGEQS